MTDRDHLVALIAAVENLSADSTVETTENMWRLIHKASRARKDVYPQDS